MSIDSPTQARFNLKLAGLMSFSLHLFALALGVTLFNTTAPLVIGNPEIHILNAFIDHGDAKQTTIAQSTASFRATPQRELKPIRAEAIPTKQALALHSKTEPVHAKPSHTPKAKPATVNTSAQNAASTGIPTASLIALLHAAIQAHQRYPLSAEQMQREGRVTLTFTLYEDGSIAHLSVAHSSGTDSLDQAALAAVQEATPFSSVRPYLHGIHDYQIDVVFQLA